MLTRREYLAFLTLACAGLSLPRFLNAQLSGPLITGTIPSTGEELPIIGLGSSATFGRIAQQGDLERIKAVMQMMVDCGGSVFDTAPGYRASEAAAGRAIHELGIADRIFWATKLNVAGFRGGSADPDEARAQVEASFQRLDRGPIDLIQVHNLGDMATQFAILRELKDAGRVRYIGTTSTFKPQYEALAGYMRNEPLDFVGIDYAVDNLSAENELFRIAQDRGIAVMVYMPFGRNRLWNRVEGREVPSWASEFGAETWAQFFLKFAASHPSVTVVTPATSRPEHMLDNMTAARGRLPTEAERERMIAYVEALPDA